MPMTRGALLTLALAATLATPLGSSRAEDNSNLETLVVSDTLTIGIAHFENPRTDIMMVIDQWVLADTLDSYELTLGDHFGPETKTGNDITGDGHPDMIVESFSGGAHCCFSYYLYALEPAFKQLAEIDTGSSGAQFEKHDGITGLVMTTGDNTFAYWYAPYSGSPTPVVKLTWDGTAYVMSPELMAAPAPATDALAKEAAEIATSDWWTATDMYSRLWGEMLDLIYSGHADLAWVFLEGGWPEGRSGMDTFKTNFRCQLAQSPYWNTLAAMNNIAVGDVPADCSGNTGG